jgi:hypothetical protein
VVSFPNTYFFSMNMETDPKIGGNSYSAHDIYLAVEYGVVLQDAGQGRGSKLLAREHAVGFTDSHPEKSSQYPNGRFPHPFTVNKGPVLGFPANCPANDDRKEYPLVNNGPYNGGLNNNKWGNERVVYMYENGEIDNDGHPQANFCGIMTHTGAAETGGFVLC